MSIRSEIKGILYTLRNGGNAVDPETHAYRGGRLVLLAKGLPGMTRIVYGQARTLGASRREAVIVAGRRALQSIATVMGALALLVACGGGQGVTVPLDSGDAGMWADDAATPPVDAPEGTDAGVEPDATTVDAPPPVPGSCEPDRAPGAVSHNDCRRYADRPICDAISERCVEEPHALCGACETDAQCQAGVDLSARCVFMQGDIDANSDSACLVPCGSNADCAWIMPAYGWTAQGVCEEIGGARYCIPEYGHCRNPDSTRQGG